MSRLCYLMDEDTPGAIRDQLLRRQPAMKVLAVGDEMAPAYGMLDPHLLQWIEREGFVLVSRNRRTLPGTFGSTLRLVVMCLESFCCGADLHLATLSMI